MSMRRGHQERGSQQKACETKHGDPLRETDNTHEA